MKRINLNGTRWTISFGDPGRGNAGICKYEEKEIIIRPTATQVELVGFIIHEASHVALPDLNEEAILRLELTIMKVLKASDFFKLLEKEE